MNFKSWILAATLIAQTPTAMAAASETACFLNGGKLEQDENTLVCLTSDLQATVHVINEVPNYFVAATNKQEIFWTVKNQAYQLTDSDATNYPITGLPTDASIHEIVSIEGGDNGAAAWVRDIDGKDAFYEINKDKAGTSLTATQRTPVGKELTKTRFMIGKKPAEGGDTVLIVGSDDFGIGFLDETGIFNELASRSQLEAIFGAGFRLSAGLVTNASSSTFEFIYAVKPASGDSIITLGKIDTATKRLTNQIAITETGISFISSLNKSDDDENICVLDFSGKVHLFKKPDGNSNLPISWSSLSVETYDISSHVDHPIDIAFGHSSEMDIKREQCVYSECSSDELDCTYHAGSALSLDCSNACGTGDLTCSVSTVAGAKWNSCTTAIDTDSDNNGTPDCNDECFEDPNKTAAGACGSDVADSNDGEEYDDGNTDNDPDDDCDGIVDSDCEEQAECTPSTEICDNQIDEDCDGADLTCDNGDADQGELDSASVENADAEMVFQGGGLVMAGGAGGTSGGWCSLSLQARPDQPATTAFLLGLPLILIGLGARRRLRLEIRPVMK